MTAMDVAPVEFIRLAGQSGCDAVSVFTSCPAAILPGQASPLRFPTITPAMRRDVQAALVSSGTSVNGVEYFPVVAGLDPRDYEAGLALGAELGGVRAVTHVHDTEEARSVDAIGRLCELAAAQGLTLGVEFTPMTRGCDSLAKAAWLVDQVARPDFGISLDCLHLVRSGAGVGDVSQLDARYFRSVQVCDGHGLEPAAVYMGEAHDREIPGKGDFPLAAILNALPAALPIEIEVPSLRCREAGVSAGEHVARAIACTRDLVAGLSPTR